MQSLGIVPDLMTYTRTLTKADGSREHQELHAVLTNLGVELPNHRSAIDNLDFTRLDLKMVWKKVAQFPPSNLGYGIT